MTKSKFASLTAGLLARKGEAIPTAHSALMQASAFAEVARPHDHPVQKNGAPHDLAALIERAARPVHGAVYAPKEHGESKVLGAPPVAAAIAQPEPHAVPAAAPFQVLRPRFAAVPSFGLRGRAAEAARPVVVSSANEHRLHRTAVTVRLDEPRYLRLKLAHLRYQRTYQDILTRALDAYLTALGIAAIDESNVESWRTRLSPPTIPR
jgi:hypothetical protein